MMNKISVIVPVFNLRSVVETTVGSICEQTYSDLEIILVDDGSTDGSSELLDDLSKKDDRINVIHEEHKGVLQSRLTGTKAARGRWVGFVDGDDMLKPEMYERLLENALEYHADISHCGYEIVDPDGVAVMYHGTGNTCLQNPLDMMKTFAKDEREEWWSLCNKIYDRNLFSGNLFEILKDLFVESNEDLLMNYLLVKGANKMIYEDRCWYRYIQRTDSASFTDSASKRLDRIRVRRMLRDWAPESLYELHQLTYLRMCVSEYTYLYRKNESDEILAEIRNMLTTEKESFRMLDDKRALMADMIVNYEDAYKTVVSNIERRKNN